MIIGVTGKYGVGKSEVAQELARLSGGVFVDADKVVHEMYRAGGIGARVIAEVFGDEFLGEDGSVDRKKLGDLVFANEEERRKLNAAIHPIVADEIERQVVGDGVFVVEAFDFDEKYLGRLIDKLVLVEASMERLLENVKERGVDEGRVNEILEKQGDLNEWDVKILNDGDLRNLRKKVGNVWKELASL